ncbi:signal peptide peptidase SppA [Segatella copri]|uniref:signal peptide peptidase SppA n=1 Tax=Segatella copri TaxID=165179 RepID=UPI001F3D5F9E|nr:signal peptide peptidase SppA [Segatella copri]
MKQFFKNVAATIVGIFGFGIIMVILAVITFIGMMCNSSKTPSLKDNSVMVMKLQGQISDQANDDWLGQLTGNQYNNLGMNNILSAIKKAKQEDKVKGIYLETGILSTDYATLQEIRNALADFKKSGKWIIAYGDAMTQGGYYLASVANKVYVNPEGSVDWHGIASQTQYIKDVAAKFGVHFTIVKVGKYKSFTEMYTEDKMSDANREQVTRYIGGLWNQILADVSKSRNISKDSLNRYADGLMAFDDTKLLKSRKMVDGFCYYDEIRDVIKKQLGLKTDEKICQVSMSDVNAAVDDSNLLGDQIAVYYCQGEIVRVATPGAFGSEQQIVSNEVIQDLQDLGNDKNIKAVVLRINSGGGDAYASEQIWRAVSQLNKKKPVVVSMGGMAASGAYYMSMGASYIMAQPTTLTGSIGIFGALPDISDLMTKKLGFKYDEVKTNRNSAYGSAGSARPWSAEEIGHLQAYVNRGYGLFRQRVADGRKMKTEEVEKIAQGRVWLGTDAKSIKLIDGFGSLDDAVAKAAQLAKVSDYGTTEYPMPTDWIDQLLDGLSGSGGNYLDEQLRLTLGDLYQPFMMIRNIKEKEPVQAAMPFVLNIH